MITRPNLIDLKRTYSVEEFEALPDDGNRYELIKGKLVMAPATGDDHGVIVGLIYKHWVLLDPAEKFGMMWFTTGIVLTPDYLPEPDLAYITASRRPPRSKKAIDVIPDLVVEVWSPSQLTKKGPDKASLEKIQDYLAAGVRIVWSVNPDNQTVDVYHLGQTNPVRTLALDDELDGEDVIPGFKLKVQALFE